MTRRKKTGGRTLVYSTDEHADVKARCKGCLRPRSECRCSQSGGATDATKGAGVVYLHRETKGRKGKGVTLIKGLALPPVQLQQLAKHLKTSCGVGGTVKQGIIELHSADREKIRAILIDQGMQVKIAGG